MGRATQRSIEILELIATSDTKLTHAAIARDLNIPKSTLTDILRDLVAQQYLELDDAGKYLMGSRVLLLSRSYLTRMDLVSRSRDVLARLSAEAGEVAMIAIRQKHEIVVVAQEMPTKPLLAAMTIGDRAPAGLTAVGKAILAFSGEGVLVEILSAKHAWAPGRWGKAEEKALRLELDAIRGGAVALNKQAWIEGVSAIARPVMNAEGAIAAVAVSLPESRLTEEWLRHAEPSLHLAAEELSMRMGCNPSLR